jgi:hypothetical protein
MRFSVPANLEPQEIKGREVYYAEHHHQDPHDEFFFSSIFEPAAGVVQIRPIAEVDRILICRSEFRRELLPFVH